MADRYSMPSIRGDDPLQTFQLQSALMRQRQPNSRAQFARALMQQGASTAPVNSWVEGLARALQGTVGGYMAGQDDREGKESERQMLADMVGQSSQKKAEEASQLAQAGVPGFQMPMPNPEAGVAYAQPTAPAGGGPEVVPQGMLQPAPQPAARPVNAEMIAALSGMAGQGNRTAAGALPGFQFQYQDTYQRERDTRQEALAAAREARMAAAANRETFSAPVTVMGPDGKPALVQISNTGTVRPLQGGYQPPPEQDRETYGQPVIETVNGKPALVRYGSRGGRQVVPGATPEAPSPPENFPGTGVDSASLRLVTNPNSDNTTPAFAAAFEEVYGTKTFRNQDGSFTTVTREAPPEIRRPAGRAAGGVTPVPANPAAPANPSAPPSTTTQVPGATITQTGGAAQRLSPAEMKLKEETETSLQGLESTKLLLDQALTLSKDAYAGFGATARGTVAGQTGFNAKTAEATRRFQSIMGTQALERLKEIFGGNPTEGERKILLDLQASANMSRTEREALIRDAQKAIARRQPFLKQRLEEVTSGRYGRIGGPPAAGPTVPALRFDRMGNPISGD